MALQIGALVMLPGYQPYPRFGRIAKLVDADGVVVTEVQCGDPRCASEHHHADSGWPASQLEAAAAYQGRASWEQGRESSPNAVLRSL